jgi:dipeptidyl aminopeptidase/acylaminoacyl peptidase
MKTLSLVLAAAALLTAGCARDRIAEGSLKPVSERLAVSSPSENNTPIVYELPGMDAVRVATIPFDGELAFDIYYPPEYNFRKPLPLVLIVNGLPDSQVTEWMGYKTRDLHPYISSGQLLAASGMAAVVHDSNEWNSKAVLKLMDYLRENAAYLRIDLSRIGLWARSSNPSAAQGLLAAKQEQLRGGLKCAVFYYGGDPAIELTPPKGFPILLVRAGQDEETNRDEVDPFRAAAVAAGAELTVVEYPEGEHGFDIWQDTDRSREILAQTLEYLKKHLLGR